MPPLASMMVFGYPVEFWIAVALLVGLIVEALRSFPRKTWAIPAFVVYATVGVWYLGNLIQTGPTDFLEIFGVQLTQIALWQVICFLLVYRCGIRLLLSRRDDPGAQFAVADRLHPEVLATFLRLAFFTWIVLFGIGLWMAGGKVLAILWPPSSEHKVGMFGHSGVGSGGDFMVAAGGYIYVLICSIFGIIAVLGRGAVRGAALAMVALTWPYFWFDRLRSMMLATLLPSTFCYWVATRGGWWRKAAVSALMFGFVNLWFLNVKSYRGAGEDATMEMLLDFSERDQGEHLGLDMLSELCYMDNFIEMGTFTPNWGMRYFSEIANVVPRTFWPGKPFIGIDYAVARGFGSEVNGNAAGVLATVSTGMIGQGVNNFGRVFGVAAAAMLMVAWTAVLGRLWRRRFELPRFLLFAIGCGLTFNMGRDITLLVLWPFVFGYGFAVLIEKFGSLKRRPVVARVSAPDATHDVALHPRV